jgi:hypothetical protein
MHSSRSHTYKVLEINDTSSGTFVKVVQYPKRPLDLYAVSRIEDGYDVMLRCGQAESLRLDEVEMLEENGGKAGALNVFANYLRAHATEWCATSSEGSSQHSQILMGIVDARHMLSEPGTSQVESSHLHARFYHHLLVDSCLSLTPFLLDRRVLERRSSLFQHHCT